MRKIFRKIRSGFIIIKKDGLLTFLINFLEKFQYRLRKKHEFKFLVKEADLLKADWSQIKTVSPPKLETGKPIKIAWVMSPPGEGSGGHQNIFRFIKFAEDAGHQCSIFLYTQHDTRTMREIKECLQSYPSVQAKISWLKKSSLDSMNAVFATGWETAYPVFNTKASLKKFYFVQDYEPYFYPVGSEYILAENTYRFNFFGVTAGGWLAKKLEDDFGMNTASFEFGADKSNYKLLNKDKRKEIFFYARPVTARRGFELGIMALELFHKKHPDYVINLVGWDVSEYKIPFPHKNLKTLPLKKLPDLYNNCAAGLVMSLTNMSLLPLEMLACGTIPVMNDGKNNRLVSDNPYIAYAPNNPHALSEELSSVVSKQDLPDFAAKAAKSVKTLDWQHSGEKFVEIVESEIYG